MNNEKYFYQGYRIAYSKGHWLVLAPIIDNKLVAICKTKNNAKEWVEQKDRTSNELMKLALRIEKLLKN